MLSVIIIDYPNSLQSAVHGLKELFLLANDCLEQNGSSQLFAIKILKPSDASTQEISSHIVIVPPSLGGDYYLTPEPILTAYLARAHQAGSLLCSACAGSFILASSGLLESRQATTHWHFEKMFRQVYPDVNLDIERLLINDGDIITAGGLMSWVDLGLEIVAKFTKPHIMRQLGKFLIVDTAKREQRYYQSFNPPFDHGNHSIIKVQHHIQTSYRSTLNIRDLAQMAFMSERTFLRQFFQITGCRPTQYIQRVRIQKACELLENSTHSVDTITQMVGYENANSFRKVFHKIMGLSPSAFRARFA